MVAPQAVTPKNPHRSLVRRLAWPGTISLALAVFAACGGSSTDDPDSSSSGGKGGSLGVSGSTTGGKQSTGTSGSSTGGKQSTGGSQQAQGGGGPAGASNGGTGPRGPGGPGAGAGAGPDEGGAPGKPPKPPEGMGGADAGIDCPAVAPADKSKCTEVGKCDFAELECRCDGPEADRTWKCKEPPKPMNTCPATAPVVDSACVTPEGAAPPPCHYEEPALDCKCKSNKWACI